MSININIRDGFGNQLFQYTLGRLIAEKYKLKINLDFSKYKNDSTYKFEKVGLTFDSKNKNIATNINVDLNLFNQLMNNNCNLNNNNLNISFHVEDFLLYKPHIETIRSWFIPIKKDNFNDLVIHWRTGNDIIHMNSLSNQPKENEWIDIFNKINFNKMYIVSDCNKYDKWEMKDVLDLIQIQRNRSIKEKHSVEQLKIFDSFYNPEKTLQFINNKLLFFQKFNPIWINNKDSIDDFNFIRKFDKILITASTFGWWAALLSDASEIYSYAPWKLSKGNSNKNLGKTNYTNWNQWGNI